MSTPDVPVWCRVEARRVASVGAGAVAFALYAAYLRGLEEAAAKCDAMGLLANATDCRVWYDATTKCAAAIRALARE